MNEETKQKIEELKQRLSPILKKAKQMGVTNCVNSVESFFIKNEMNHNDTDSQEKTEENDKSESIEE